MSSSHGGIRSETRRLRRTQKAGRARLSSPGKEAKRNSSATARLLARAWAVNRMLALTRNSGFDYPQVLDNPGFIPSEFYLPNSCGKTHHALQIHTTLSSVGFSPSRVSERDRSAGTLQAHKQRSPHCRSYQWARLCGRIHHGDGMRLPRHHL